jgi:transposase
MLYAGLDLSRRRLDVHLLREDGSTALAVAVAPDGDALRGLARRVAAEGEPVRATVEGMTGSRFIHDELELAGWDVLIADAQRVRGLAPLAAKTDKIDAFVLAELTRRSLVPEIWLPTPEVRSERERARFRLHLVRHRSALKNRIHATLMTFGHPVPMTDMFGVAGREMLDRLALPEPWHTNLVASLALVDDLTARVDALEVELRHLGATDRAIPLLMTVPGVGWVLAYTIASEIGDVRRFASAKKLAGYTGLCPLVRQSGGKDRRGPLAKNGPKYLRWALIEAATHAARDARYRDRYDRTKKRLGKQRGAKIARVDLARQLAEAIWWVLTKNEPFAPAGPAMVLAA